MGEEEARDGTAGIHGAGFCELNADCVLDVEKLPDDVLFGVVGLRGIACCRADASVFFIDEVFVGEVFIVPETPPFTDLLVHVFGHRFGKAVAEGFHDDARVIVSRILEGLGEDIHFVACGYGKGAEVVGAVQTLRSNVVGEAELDFFREDLLLASKEMESGEGGGAGFVGIDFNVVADGVGGPEPDGGATTEEFFQYNAVEDGASVFEEGTGLFANILAFEDGGILALELPRPKEG